jgi:hypothetical protein
LILAFVLGFFVLAPATQAEGEAADTSTEQTTTNEQITAEYNKAVRYQHLTDTWAHRRGAHNKYAHRPLRKTTVLRYEQDRAKAWYRAMTREKATTLAYLRERAAIINACVRYGAPRYICQHLLNATKTAGVPSSWAGDPSMLWVIKHESGFSPNAQNTGSTAYGLFQFLDSTWAGTGIRKTSDPHWQSVAGYKYVAGRYHTPASAKRFKLANGWY